MGNYVACRNCTHTQKKLLHTFHEHPFLINCKNLCRYRHRYSMTVSSVPTLQEQQTAIESILDIDIRHQIERVGIRADSSLINIHLELFPAGLLSEEHNV